MFSTSMSSPTIQTDPRLNAAVPDVLRWKSKEDDAALRSVAIAP